MKATRSLAFGISLVRNYAPKYPRPRPGTSEKPAFHHKDPLVNNPHATVTQLEDENLTFIHRPPPSAPSPYSLTSAPASPLLRHLAPTPTSGPLPPISRPSAYGPSLDRQVPDEDVLKMRALRNVDPKKYTRRAIADMFNVPKSFVAFAAGLKKSHTKKAIREREETHQQNRDKWTERHQIVKAIQRKRRSLW